MADPLTGLANRRSLDAVLITRIAEAERTGQPVTCLMIDVDHFKQFNDDFGHDAGDAVLREVGRVLRSATRNDGLAFRYGGEEFLLLLPGVSKEQAVARAEDVRAEVAQLKLRHNGHELGPVSASFGVATAPACCRFSDLVSAADGALLTAKARGRNRVEQADRTAKPRAA